MIRMNVCMNEPISIVYTISPMIYKKEQIYAVNYL